MLQNAFNGSGAIAVHDRQITMCLPGGPTTLANCACYHNDVVFHKKKIFHGLKNSGQVIGICDGFKRCSFELLCYLQRKISCYDKSSAPTFPIAWLAKV